MSFENPKVVFPDDRILAHLAPAGGIFPTLDGVMTPGSLSSPSNAGEPAFKGQGGDV